MREKNTRPHLVTLLGLLQGLQWEEIVDTNHIFWGARMNSLIFVPILEWRSNFFIRPFLSVLVFVFG